MARRRSRGSGEEAGVHDLRQAIHEDHLRRLCRQAPRRGPGQKKEGPKNQGIAPWHFLRDESFLFSIFSSPHTLLPRSSAEGPQIEGTLPPSGRRQTLSWPRWCTASNRFIHSSLLTVSSSTGIPRTRNFALRSQAASLSRRRCSTIVL